MQKRKPGQPHRGWKAAARKAKQMGWIGVDLDGTLAEYHGWDEGRIGKPVPLMLERVKKWIAEGKEVRIVSARFDASRPEYHEQTFRCYEWCREHIGQALTCTNKKDFAMIELWDDRCIQVIPNTGRRADGKD